MVEQWHVTAQTAFNARSRTTVWALSSAIRERPIGDGIIYLLNDRMYTTAEVTSSPKPKVALQDGSPAYFPDGLEAFVQEQKQDSGCLGFVPLTGTARHVLCRLDLEPIVRGLAVISQGESRLAEAPVLYGIQPQLF